MKTTKGKLRNVTTGILHTSMDDVYKFFEEYLGSDGIMTHHIPSAQDALLPILKTKLTEEWFDHSWLKENLDETIELPELTADEKETFWKAFEVNAAAMWEKIAHKTIAVVIP